MRRTGAAGRPGPLSIGRAPRWPPCSTAPPTRSSSRAAGSEADNLALNGVFFALRDRGDHIIATAVEHPAILEPARFLDRLGARASYLDVDGTGRIDPDDVRRAITPRTILVSVMHANNEVGTSEPIEAVGAITRERGVLLHTDAAQSVGKIPTKVNELGVDLLFASPSLLGNAVQQARDHITR